MTRVRALGPPEVHLDAEPTPPELAWRKNLALLVYLARSPQRARTRAHLIGILWGDKPEKDARHSLSEALRVLRRHLGEEALATGRGTVRLAPDAVRTDCDDFEAHAAAGEWREAAALVAGEFLEGFGVPDASDFESWLAAERAAWSQRSVDALVQWSAAERSRGHLRVATEAAERAAALGATSDAAVRALMRCRALAGDRGGALAAYEQFARRLRDEIGTLPDRDTEQLAARVRRERVWRLSGPQPGGEEDGGALRSRRSPLVGRERELRQLLDVWTDCRTHSRAALGLVSGAPGTGRSRLLEEVLGRARLDGAAAATVRAVDADRDEPWSGVFALARGGLLDAGGVAAAAPGALATFAQRVPEWADRFPAARAAAVVPPGRALSDVVRAIAGEQSLVLAVDDAHLLDHDSLVALGGLLRDGAGAPVLVALVVGEPVPIAIDELRAALGRDIPGVHVQLGALDEAAVRALSGWAVPSYAPAELDRLVRRIAADSAGLPLLAVELLHAVANGLDLQGPVAPWPAPDRTLDQTLPGELPDAVIAALRVGFRRLSEGAQRVLAAAAVLPPRATPAVLGRASGIDGEALSAALDELEWQRWLVGDPQGYDFLARIVREVVARDMVTPGQRLRLQRAAESGDARGLRGPPTPGEVGPL